MKKTITRRHFLTGAAAAGGTALFAQSSVATRSKAAQYKERGAATPAELTENYRHQAAYNTLARTPVANLVLSPHWFNNSSYFWYRNAGPENTFEFILVDTEMGTRKPAFDHTKLASALSRVTHSRVLSTNLPFSEIEFVPDMSAVVFTAADTRWQCNVTSYVCTLAGTSSAKVTPNGSPAEIDPSPVANLSDAASPDGKWEAEIRDYNVWIKPVHGGSDLQLTRDGTAALPYGAISWSPQSNTLICSIVDAVITKNVYMVESSPTSGTRGVLHSHEYDQPGDAMTSYTLHVLDVPHIANTRVQIDKIQLDDPQSLRWSQSGDAFLVELTDRGHQRFRIMKVDTASGRAVSVVDERSQTFINTSNNYIHYTSEAKELIYASEQDGWRHLYLYDAQTCRLKNQITHGAWVVRTVEKVDELNRTIWFKASGRIPDQDPYLVQYYRINFDGSGLVQLSDGDGDHHMQYSPDRRWAVDTYSRADMPPVHNLRRTKDGALVCPLEKSDIDPLSKSGWRPPQVYRAKGRDGTTNIWGLVFRPLHFDPDRKYPVIENIYAGPQDSFVRKNFAVEDGMQALAELGFIVVQCDGMGTRNRSKSFHDACWHNLKDAGLPDRIAWIKTLAKEFPYCDTSRVGIYGTSAGGQSSTGALLFHPEFYKVAVSSCGCHDNRVDKRWWNEQWMGYPVGPWYAESSNVVHAANLRGKLLLMVGELDTNVPPESTLRVVDALIKSKKDFDLLVLPGMDHTSGGDYGERRRQDYFVRHLLHCEPPDRNIPQPPGTPVALKPIPIDQESSITFSAGAETTITFRNHTNFMVQLFWLRGDNTRASYGTIAAGDTREIQTYDGHVWLIVGPDSKDLNIFVAEDNPGIADISMPIH